MGILGASHDDVGDHNSNTSRGHNRSNGSGVHVKKNRKRGRPRESAFSGQKVIAASDSDIIRCNDIFLEDL